MNLNPLKLIAAIPEDKLRHYLGGSIIAFFFSFLSLPIAAGSVLVVALGKEISDWVSNARRKARGELPTHGVELLDILWTVFGGFVVLFSQFWRGFS